MRARSPRLSWLLGAGVALAACSGRIGDTPSEEAAAAACSALSPGDAPLRRLTRFEYDNTVRDLLGDDTAPAAAFAPDALALGFDDQAASQTMTALLAEQYQTAAERIAARAVADLPGLLGCDPHAIGEEACARHFIRAFGKRAFRRPLDAGQEKRLSSLYAWGRARYDFSTGIELVIQAALQAPSFLYRIELGMPDPAAPGVTMLDPYETASRLSYLLWASMPDAELLAAAGAGRLGTAAEIEAQARRMLADPRARAAVQNFHRQWLGLDGLDMIAKDGDIYPDYQDTLRPLWKTETLRFLDSVVFDDRAGLPGMLTAPYSMMNADLAAFYGVSGPAGEAFERVELDPARRSGLLTRGGVLALYAKANQSSPVQRGKLVRTRLLCQTLPPPPNGMLVSPPVIDPHATTREKFQEHSADPSCAGCHELMDPIGFGFEHYDAVGAWRDQDHGLPVDARGEILATTDADGPFDGAAPLGERLAASEDVRRCLVTQWFRFAHGRGEGPEDACSLGKLDAAFAAAGHDVVELLVALTQTDAFRYRKVVVPGK